MQNPNPSFWQGKRVLLTGHTGFKGGWLVLWLNRLGADITGIALLPNTQPNLYKIASINELTHSHLVDIHDVETTAKIIEQANPEIVFHMAAQPLVRASYTDPLGTFSTNIQGTANILEALRSVNAIKAVIAITTDKVYRNAEHVYPYREDDPLGGHDPYSASKAAAEIVIASYRDAFLANKGIAVASVRAGNVIGGGDWSEDRLIPDAVRAWSADKTLHIRRPEAIRPWQHVLEPLNGYLLLAEKLWDDPKLAGSYNFGPKTCESATVQQVIEMARQIYKQAKVDWTEQIEGLHEAGWLALEIAKARHQLSVVPRWNLATGISHTMNWYQELELGKSAIDLCHHDINAFEDSVAG